MNGEIVRVDRLAQVKIKRPDGTVIEYSGPSAELTVLVSQLEERHPVISYEQLIQWANRLQKLQPLILVAGFFVGCLALLFWATRPGDTYYQPQSQEASYEWSA